MRIRLSPPAQAEELVGGRNGIRDDELLAHNDRELRNCAPTALAKGAI
jgi:hypothetical protein